MSQQAKDIYSGIKKIFPSSRRSGSFSFTGRGSSSVGDRHLDADLAAAQAAAQDPAHKKKKERRPSFSFSGWKDKHRASSAGDTPSTHPPEPVVMSLPYGATAATPKGKAPSDPEPAARNSLTKSFNNAFHTAPSRGSLFGKATANPDAKNSRKPQGNKSQQPLSANGSAGAASSRSSRSSRNSTSSNGSNGASTPHSSFSTTSFDLPLTQPPKLSARSVSVGGDRPCTGNRSLRNSGVHGNAGLQLSAGGTLSSTTSSAGRSVGSARQSKLRSSSHGLADYNSMKSATSGSYRSSSSAIAHLTAPSEAPLFPPVSGNGPSRSSVGSSTRSSVQPHTLQQFPQPKPADYDQQRQAQRSSVVPPVGAPVFSPQKLKNGKKPRVKKERGMSLTFTSSKQKKKEKAEAQAQASNQHLHDALSSTIVKPHASTWDSDSDDDYEDTKRPTRGLDRRSQSMDFMEQAPTHLISKIWRKLPIQARLIGGRGSIDLDLQKDRTSFSRSSEARKFAQAAEKAAAAEHQRRTSSGRKVPSPVPRNEEEVLSPGMAKRTRFSLKVTYFLADANDGATGAYTALESYDDVLVRVCRFASHDQRPTSTKVQEFLERSMAFLHGTRTKHGNVVSMSNEEIRMWRRLALHNWMLEEVTTAQAAAALGVQGKDVEAPSSRTSSSVTEGTDSDSDSQQQGAGRRAAAPRRLQSVALARSLSESVAEEEPEEEEEEELELPRKLKLDKLCGVVNCCVNFGERLFTTEEVDDLVRLEFLVEEDGWI
ncbi:hypothetical protein BBJ28_00023974 [Nothophytophthora sp. Chile5]|nr:hypothetical protein BBJ28_00023974 [Nothophytophthora sp. Chile5]